MDTQKDLDDQKGDRILKEKFDRDGFVAIASFLSADEIKGVQETMARIIADDVPGMAPEKAFYEVKGDRNTLKQIQSLDQVDPFFHRMLFGSRFEQLAALLLEDGVEGKNLQYFNKPPMIGQATPPHHDGYYFMLSPNEAVTMWLALEDVDEENGCVRYVKGSHLGGVRPHGKSSVLGFSQGIQDFGTDADLALEVKCPAKAGDLLVHHSLTVHRAEGNKSASRSRKALGLVYYADRAKQDVVAKEAYARELAETLRREQKI